MKTALRVSLLVTVWIAVGAGVVLLGMRFKQQLGAFLCLACLALPFLYFLVCTLYPAWGDMKCPKCGKAALRRPDKKLMLGVKCDACGYHDPDMYRAYLDEME